MSTDTESDLLVCRCYATAPASCVSCRLKRYLAEEIEGAVAAERARVLRILARFGQMHSIAGTIAAEVRDGR